MAIHVDGIAWLGMHQPFGNNENRNAMVQHQRGCCLPEIVKADGKPEALRSFLKSPLILLAVSEELKRLKDFQQIDPYREGHEFDYFRHSSGIQFILDETKKR